MRRFSRALLCGLLALIVCALPANAGVSWCRSDPIVELGGVTYQVIVVVPDQHVSQINAALDFTFVSPVGTEQKLLFVDSGFNGHGETVTFATHRARSGHTMRLDVKHTGSTFPVRVEIYKNGNLAVEALGTSDIIIMKLPK